MMNLFSSFNPVSSTYYSLNWLILIVPMILTPNKYWLEQPPSISIHNILIKSLMKQFKSSINKHLSMNMLMIMTLMMMITTMNLAGMIPYSFPPSSQMSVNMILSLTMWMSTCLNKMNNMKTFISHLTPSGTPFILMPFMVLIETISMMIQPMTLSIRLTANMTAGHILMTLITTMYQYLCPTMIIHMVMMIMELAVSMVQAYVFSMLIIMYLI